MTDREKLIAALKDFTKAPVQVVPAKVKTVDEDKGICSVEPINEPDMYGVRLRASIDNSVDGPLFIPALDSWVLVALIGNSDKASFVVQYTKVDKWLVKIGDKTFEMNADGYKLNGDQFGSMMKIDEVVSKLNAVEDKINALIDVFNAWTPVAQDGGAALKSSPNLISWLGQRMSKTTSNDLKNEVIKHG